MDHVFFGSGADSVDLGNLMASGDSAVHNVGAGDRFCSEALNTQMQTLTRSKCPMPDLVST